MGQPADARSDVYSIGIIAFEMLTGVLPFTADSALGIAMKQISEPVPGNLSLYPDVSPRAPRRGPPRPREAARGPDPERLRARGRPRPGRRGDGSRGRRARAATRWHGRSTRSSTTSTRPPGRAARPRAADLETTTPVVPASSPGSGAARLPGPVARHSRPLPPPLRPRSPGASGGSADASGRAPPDRPTHGLRRPGRRCGADLDGQGARRTRVASPSRREAAKRSSTS